MREVHDVRQKGSLMSEGASPHPDFSVVIATRNRASSLRETLQALAHQQTSGRFAYEVLVVDNGSTDATRQVLEEMAAQSPVPLRRLYEAQRGQPWALNRGLQEAKGSLLAFTDDDVLPVDTWLWAMWMCFADRRVHGVAGRTLPLWAAPRPHWLTDDVAFRLGGIGCVDYGTVRLSSADQHNVCWVGGNMAVRREVVQRLGRFDPRFLSQDTEYYHRCLRYGFTVAYEPLALVYHRLGAERMTPAYFRQRRHLYGYDAAYWRPWKRSSLVWRMPLEILGAVVRWLYHVLTLRPWIERFQVELDLQWRVSLWLHRLQLLPGWWVKVLTGRGRPCLEEDGGRNPAG